MRYNNSVEKYLIFISILIFSAVAYGDCINKTEEENIDLYIESNQYDNEVEFIPNYFKCVKAHSKLEKYVCKDKKLLKMFHVLAMARIAFWERNKRHEVSHKSFNNENINSWINTYNASKLSNVCFDLKEQTTNYLGGEAPYKVGDIDGMENIVFVQTNEHGISLQFNKKILYLGKSCDVIDSQGAKGRWYKNGNKYIINIGSTVLKLNANENIIISSKCSKELEPAQQTKVKSLKSVEVVKEKLNITPPKNVEVIKTEKSKLIKQSASGSISLTLLASLLGLFAWRTS